MAKEQYFVKFVRYAALLDEIPPSHHWKQEEMRNKGKQAEMFRTEFFSFLVEENLCQLQD